MSPRLILFASLLSLTIYSGCQSRTPQPEPPKNNWGSNMQSLALSITDLLPYIFNQAEFMNPKNRPEIEAKIKVLSQSTHGIPVEKGKELLGNDPLLQFAVKNLEGNMEQAYSSFKSGHYDYSRHLLKNSVGFCFHCHTTSKIGPEYQQWKLDFSHLQITPVEKAKIYIATRQYDKAVELLETNLKTESRYHSNPLAQEKSLKAYLALMIRIKNDPQKAYAVVEDYLSHDNIPVYLKESALEWKKSLRNWMTSKEKNNQSFKTAERLVNQAKNLRRLDSMDAANIEYLRASSILHQELLKSPSKQRRAEIYSLLGNCYDVLSDTGFWDLPELYYETCIREFPGSSLAKSCFKNYEKNIILGFSGSAGIFIPQLERNKINQLKKMAGL